jgi:hypothetical protein
VHWLKGQMQIDRRKYKTGIKVTPEEFSDLNIKPNKFHGEWNYTLHNKKM